MAPVTRVTIAKGFHKLPLPIAQLSLAAVLKCGQSFRWKAYPLTVDAEKDVGPVEFPTHEYRFCLRDRVVCLRQTSDALYYRSVCVAERSKSSSSKQSTEQAETLAWIRDYFQLDIDLEALYDQWAIRDPVFYKLKERFAGIRILRQDPFECLTSFICSSNNNISRITNMVNALCVHFSPALLHLAPPDKVMIFGSELQTYHPFPPPSALCGPDVSATLRSLGFGYRAEFIQKTAKMLVDLHGSEPLAGSTLEPSEVWLRTLRDMQTDAARAELLKFMGVGRKVADCILLMSLDKAEVIPVDTHVHQIAIKHYGMPGSQAKGAMSAKLYESVNSKLAKVWGEYAGWAHSVLFTSDLRAFSNYGLSTPPSSSSSVSISTIPTPSDVGLPSSSARRSSPLKRSRARLTSPEASVTIDVDPTAATADGTLEDQAGDLTMADRVKRRRRGQVERR